MYHHFLDFSKEREYVEMNWFVKFVNHLIGRYPFCVTILAINDRAQEIGGILYYVYAKDRDSAERKVQNKFYKKHFQCFGHWEIEAERM